MQNRTTKYVETHHKTEPNSARNANQNREQTLKHTLKSLAFNAEFFSAPILTILPMAPTSMATVKAYIND
jgi:hypothetical protein